MGAGKMNQQNRSALRGPLGASLGALAIIVLFLLIMMPGVYRSTLTVFSGSGDQSDDMNNLIAAHERNMETDVDRFGPTGRRETQRGDPPPDAKDVGC